MHCRNRELEASNTSIQDSCDYQQERCEDERSEHNKQTKILMELKTDMHDGNVEFQMLMDQTVRVKEDIARTENMAFSEHRHLHFIDEERKSIEDEARAYSQQGQELSHKSESLAVAIDSICRQIDGEDETREALRKQYRHSIGEKDILVSCCTAITRNCLDLMTSLTSRLTLAST
jgi:septal ring factor EnvC (AmiA/AmiB activator)